MNRKSRTPSILRVALAGVLAMLGCLACIAQVNVYTQRNDNSRTGANLHETILTPRNVNSKQFGRLFKVVVDGQVYTQPLYVSRLDMGAKGKHNVVFIGTMNNTIYALDADKGDVLWKANFGRPVLAGDVEHMFNITRGSGIGILSTPVIDPDTDTIYFFSRNEQGQGASGVFTQWLNALDIRTGEPRQGSHVQVTATYTDADGTFTFDPRIQNQRAALTLANGKVYISWASNDDLGLYHGWVISYDAKTLKQQDVYVDTPSGIQGGIWQSGQGLTVDAQGNLLISTGNGSFGTSPKGVPQTGNSFIKLSADLKLLDYFTPYDSEALNRDDADLGSAGLLLVPGTNYIISGGKQGYLYVVDSTNMGKFDPAKNHVNQFFHAVYGKNSSNIHAGPVYFDSAVNGPTVYLWGENDFLRAYHFDPKAGMLTTEPFAKSAMTAPAINANGAMPGGFYSVSANGKEDGIVWASTPYNDNAQQKRVPGVLYAFDANTLKVLWSDKQNPARDEGGYFPKFVDPTIADGKVFIPNFGSLHTPDGSGELNVYGLLPH
ncbi:MAG TPA: hypothetical protein VGD64_01965 [Acidisarcina sp.]